MREKRMGLRTKGRGGVAHRFLAQWRVSRGRRGGGEVWIVMGLMGDSPNSDARRMRRNSRMLARGNRGNSAKGIPVPEGQENEKLPFGSNSRMLLLSG